jgi:hypothetical protein
MRRLVTLAVPALLALGPALADHAEGGTGGEVEGLQEATIVRAMGVVESRMPRGQCLRFVVCVGDHDPSPAIRTSIRKAGYGAVRWCSDSDRMQVPVECKKTVIHVLAPEASETPITEAVFEIAGPLTLHCRIPIDAGHMTTLLDCAKPKAR